MAHRTRQIGLLLLFVALFSIVFLAAGLDHLQLHSGDPFPSGGGSGNVDPSLARIAPTQGILFPILRGIFALVFLALVVYLPFRLITLVNRKTFFRLLLALGVLILVGYLMPRIPGQPNFYPAESSDVTSSLSFDYPVAPLGKPPQALVWLVIIGILLGVGLFATKILKRWRYPPKMEDRLLREAEDAFNAIQAGLDLKNVIIRCYVQMSRLLKEEQGIERNYSMTVREFEDWLESKGFPAEPVHQLTGLFEKVRYGRAQMNYHDETIAFESLNEIIQFCRS